MHFLLWFLCWISCFMNVYVLLISIIYCIDNSQVTISMLFYQLSNCKCIYCTIIICFPNLFLGLLSELF